MKNKIFKGIGIIILIFICLLCCVSLLGVTIQSARTFSGHYEATSLSEVYSYQQEINSAALEIDAAILESNIIIASPIKYRFQVLMPDFTPFEYGEVLPWGSGFGIVFGILIVGVFLFFMVFGVICIVET